MKHNIVVLIELITIKLHVKREVIQSGMITELVKNWYVKTAIMNKSPVPIIVKKNANQVIQGILQTISVKEINKHPSHYV